MEGPTYLMTLKPFAQVKFAVETRNGLQNGSLNIHSCQEVMYVTLLTKPICGSCQENSIERLH